MQDVIPREDGAVTVDRGVLTAALVGLGPAVMAVIGTGLEDLSGDIGGRTARNPNGMTSADLIADYDRIFPE